MLIYKRVQNRTNSAREKNCFCGIPMATAEYKGGQTRSWEGGSLVIKNIHYDVAGAMAYWVEKWSDKNIRYEQVHKRKGVELFLAHPRKYKRLKQI